MSTEIIFYVSEILQIVDNRGLGLKERGARQDFSTFLLRVEWDEKVGYTVFKVGSLHP
ncbi:MAG: hypothetical protein PVH61_42475 [Candidatus Aminicenantes bacterium]